MQALVIAWEHRGGTWMAFIVWVSDAGQIIQEWVPADRLGPVPALERQMPGNPNYSRWLVTAQVRPFSGPGWRSPWPSRCRSASGER